MSTMAKRAVFVMPSASGHVNPSLPVARRLVSLGWSVTYVGRPQYRDAIEDTGATFFDWVEVAGSAGTVASIMAVLSEYDDPGALMWGHNFGSIVTLRLLQPFIEWFRECDPTAVVYCPVLCVVARFAAMYLKIPSVSLLTANGPGYLDAAFATHGGTAAGFVEMLRNNEPNNNAVAALRKALGMPELTLNTAEPLVFDYYAEHNLVSTIASLADPLNEEASEAYRVAGKAFTFTGPLLDVKGAKRAAGYVVLKQPDNVEQQVATAATAAEGEQRVLKAVEEAVTKGHHVVYVSMGTVLTGDNPDYGWGASVGSALTGKHLCQAVYRGVFEAVGSEEKDATTLIIVSLGPMPDALDNITLPRNVICEKQVPQVDLLRLQTPVVFVSNGGQNSLNEGMAVGSPFVVCPGFGDQIANANQVVARGLGLMINRPKEKTAEETDRREGTACIAPKMGYQAAVAKAVRHVIGDKKFARKAGAISTELGQAGGVDKAVAIVIEAAQGQ